MIHKNHGRRMPLTDQRRYHFVKNFKFSFRCVNTFSGFYENRAIITVGRGGPVIEFIFSAAGFGRTAVADRRGTQKSCTGIRDKVLTNFVTAYFFTGSTSSGTKTRCRTDLF